MTYDLIKRLRDWVPAEGPPEGRTAPDAVADMREAANRIEALTAENERLLSVLTEWEEWEGKLLMDNRAWADGDGCHIPQDLFDEYVIGPQQRRGLALAALEEQP